MLDNTRFQENPFKDTAVAQEGAKNPFSKAPEGKIGLDGKEIEKETPKVNGFSFVKTPSPSPGKYLSGYKYMLVLIRHDYDSRLCA